MLSRQRSTALEANIDDVYIITSPALHTQLSALLTIGGIGLRALARATTSQAASTIACKNGGRRGADMVNTSLDAVAGVLIAYAHVLRD